jgi:hypothetical protein
MFEVSCVSSTCVQADMRQLKRNPVLREKLKLDDPKLPSMTERWLHWLEDHGVRLRGSGDDNY